MAMAMAMTVLGECGMRKEQEEEAGEEEEEKDDKEEEWERE